MRLVHYSVIELSTGKRLFSHCQKCEAEKFITNLHNPENYKIVYKWVSI